MEAGQRGIPVAVVACGERLVSCEPVAGDLEAAFLALTNSGETTAGQQLSTVDEGTRR